MSMKDTQETIRGYAEDLLACHRHVVGAMKQQSNDESLASVPAAYVFVQQAIGSLESGIGLLEARIKQLGGPDFAGQAEQAFTRVTGFMAGVYGRMRGETASRMLRDDSTAISFLIVCSTMLHATAGALGDGATTLMAREVLQPLPALLTRVNELIPRAVVQEVGEDFPTLKRDASEATIVEMKQLWQAIHERTRAMSAASATLPSGL
jgi:hypothetical protein